MPSSVKDLFDAAGLTRLDPPVRWGQPPPLKTPGVYVVALTGEPDRKDSTGPVAQVDADKLRALLQRRPELRLDGSRPSPEELRQRLSGFWLPDEPVLYIGMTSASVRKRVTAYYRTSLGDRSPHAGGWFIQTLRNMDMLWVHFGSAAEPLLAEERMLAAFAGSVGTDARASVHDPDRLMPFANLRGPLGPKRHGITGAKEPRGPQADGARGRSDEGVPPPIEPSPSRAEPMKTRPPVQKNRPPPTLADGTVLSQPVTAGNLSRGRVRIGIASEGKKLLPAEKARVTIILRGRAVPGVLWDPRMGPDKERSGVLGVGKHSLVELVEADERLVLRKLGADQFSLD